MTDHVYIDGRRHEVVTQDALENLTWPNFEIDLPPGAAGWATTQVGDARFAAWIKAPGEVAS